MKTGSDIKQILEHFEKTDPKIHKFMLMVKFEEWVKPKPQTEHELFIALCRIIVGQQVSGKAAASIFNKFTGSFGKKKVTPQLILATPDQNLRDTGLSWAKVKYVKDLAQNFADKKIKLSDLEAYEDEQVVVELTKVKGLGRWSAEMFLMFILGRENVFSYGDLGLKKGLQKIYNKKTINTKQIEKIVKKWEPYKTYGSVALWQSLE